MKRKTMAMICAIAVLTCTGCGSAKTTVTPTETVEEVEVDTQTPEETKELQEPEEQVVEPEIREIEVSDWGFEKISAVTNETFIVLENEKYYVIDKSGAKCPDEIFNGVSNEWDGYKSNISDGNFIVFKKLEEGRYTSFILNQNLETIYCAMDKDYYIENINDGFLMVANDKKIGIGHVDTGEHFRVYDKGRVSFMSLRGNYLTVNFNEYITGIGVSWLYDLEDYKISLLSNESTPPEFLFYRYNGKNVVFMNNTPNKEGWLNVGTVTIDEDENEVNYSDDWEFGYFNIYTNEFVPTPNTISTTYFTDEDGNPYITAQNGFAVLTTKKDEDEVKKIFDIQKGEYVSDLEYLSVAGDFGYKKYILVENLDEEWGYVNTQTWENTEWYQDASGFCNGYALVNIEGKEYLINENMEVCSEGFEAEGAWAEKDYHDADTTNGEPLFFAKIDGLYHLVTVK